MDFHCDNFWEWEGFVKVLYELFQCCILEHVVIIDKSASRKCTPIYKWPDEEKVARD